MNNLSEKSLRLCLGLCLPVVIGLGLACATTPKEIKKSASVKTFVEPSLQSGSVKSIAVFPMRNVRLQPDELREVNRGITDGFHKQNPRLNVLGAAESVTKLNEAGLADKYSEFLRNYSQSGIPDVKILQEIGKALGVDAILQGEVFSIRQSDGTTYACGRTSLDVRYVLHSAVTGAVLWEATGSAFKVTEKVGQPSPTLYEVVQLGQEKILTALPTLAQ